MRYDCPYCGAELIHEDTWGVGPYWMREIIQKVTFTVALIMNNLKMKRQLSTTGMIM